MCTPKRSSALPFAVIVFGLVAQSAFAQREPDPLEQARDDQKKRSVAQPPAADAIIPDSDFQSELPPIDKALGQPLPPIESIDAAPSVPVDTATSSTTAPALPAAATPATATIGQAEPRSPLPSDPALGQPLIPIAAFDVEPPAPTSAETADKIPEIRYSVRVEGLSQVGLERDFRSLSSLDKGDGKGANGAVVSARAREDEQLAARILRSQGYYDAVVSSLVEPVTGQADRSIATISASPGKQYSLGTITIDGPDTVPPGLVRDTLALRPGDPIVAAAIEAAEGGVALKLPQQGYPFVKVGERDIELDDVSHLGDYMLPVDPGPRSSFGTYSTGGAKLAFDARHIGVLARFKPGELYDERRVNDLREAMVATGLFDSVAIEPQRTGQLAPDGTELVDLSVTQNAGKPRRLAATAGYSTGQGFRLDASWTHRNLFRPEGSLSIVATGGTQEQGASASFRRANAGRRDRTVLLAISAQREAIDAYTALTIGLSGRISLDSTPLWQKRWTWAYGIEILGTRENAFQPESGLRANQNYAIAGVNGQLAFDSTDSLLNPTRGFRALVRLSPEDSQTERQNSRYLRGQIDGSGYYPISSSFVAAARVRIASIAGAGRDSIAPSRRLYAGGGGSVRGYGYQELGPLDSTSDPIGGRSLVEASAELRYRFGNFGIVPFFDVGQSYGSTQPKLSDLRYGAGIGARYYTNFGPLRVDVATPLGRRPGESVVAVYVSIGQAF